MKRNFKIRQRSEDYMKFTITSEFEQQRIKKLLFRIILFLIILYSLYPLQSQAQRVQIFNTENSGLPHNHITSIAIDSLGNKWFGTYYGEVVKFDDVNWTVYNSGNSGLPGEYQINSIAIDAKDNKWFGASFAYLATGGGLVKFDNTNWTIYNTSNSGLLNNWVTAIDIDSLGNKWIGTMGKAVVKFDDTNWSIFNYSNPNLVDNWFNSIAIDDTGNKWLGVSNAWMGGGGDGGLAKFDDVNWTIYSNNSDLPYSVYCIAIDKEGNKWFGTSNGSVGALVKFDGSNWTVYNSVNSGLPNDGIASLAIDNLGNKWIATSSSGVVLFNENEITTGLSDNISVSPEDFTIYPNPAKDFISIDGLHAGTYEIINIAGAVLKNSEVQGTQAKIDISQLPKGIYTIRITKEDNVVTKKFIKN